MNQEDIKAVWPYYIIIDQLNKKVVTFKDREEYDNACESLGSVPNSDYICIGPLNRADYRSLLYTFMSSIIYGKYSY